MMEFGFGGLWRSAAAKEGRLAPERMCSRVHVSLRRFTGARAEKISLARFTCNPRATPGDIPETAGAFAAALGRYVLLVQDASAINYQARSGA